MVYSLVQVLSLLARRGRASVRHGAIVFKAPVLRLLFGGGIVGITLVIVRDGSQEEGRWSFALNPICTATEWMWEPTLPPMGILRQTLADAETIKRSRARSHHVG
jgi:hypothetical protein